MSRLLDVTAEIIDFFVCQKSALYGVVVTVLFSNATLYYRDHGTHLPYYGNGGQICARYGDRSTESLMRLCTVSRVKGGCDKTGRPICVASPSRLNLTCGIQPSRPRPKVMLSCQFRLSLLLSDRVPKGIWHLHAI